MALFVLRYVSNLLIFALGLRAPGIAGNFDSDYRTLNDGSTISSRYYQRVSNYILYINEKMLILTVVFVETR